MEIQNEGNFTDRILKNTKMFIRTSENYRNKKLNESIFRKQLPLLLNTQYDLTTFSHHRNKKEQKKEIFQMSSTITPKNMKLFHFDLKKIQKIHPFDLINNSEDLIIFPKYHSRNHSIRKINLPYSLGSFPLNLKTNKSNTSVNFFNDYEKDFFPEINYSNLNYNEFEIYKGKKIYEQLIKEKINYFKKTKNENQTIILEKKFNFKKEMSLTINSLTITFEDMSVPKEFQNKKLKIDLPFSLLPLFYYKGIQTFQKLLAAVIKVENNFEKISFNEEALYIALNHIKDFETEETEEKVNIDIIRNINDKIELLTGERKKINPISLRPSILKRNNYFLKYNYFIFFWTTNSKVYVTKITLPCISLKIVENNILIQQFIDFELLFFLYKRNFINWDFYIIKYLSGFAKFRDLFQKLGSLKPIKYMKFFLKEPKTKINTFSEEVLYNIYTDQFNTNIILKFKSFYIIINYLDTNFDCEKVYHIFFTFNQYVKLYQISKYSKKIPFLIKFIEINNETHTLTFNYEKYDEFNINNWLNNIKTFSSKSLNNEIKEEQLYMEFDIYTKKVNIEFKKPEQSIIKFENENELIKTWEIGQELETDLVNSILYGNSKNWTNLLNECLKKLNEPVPIIENTLSNLNIKKKKYKGNKSYKSNESSEKSKGTFLKNKKKIKI